MLLVMMIGSRGMVLGLMIGLSGMVLGMMFGLSGMVLGMMFGSKSDEIRGGDLVMRSFTIFASFLILR
jgi:hypothetical protein